MSPRRYILSPKAQRDISEIWATPQPNGAQSRLIFTFDTYRLVLKPLQAIQRLEVIAVLSERATGNIRQHPTCCSIA